MDKDLQEKLDAIRELAKKGGEPTFTPRIHRTSLYYIIKNKEQAERFMKKLNAALRRD